MKKAIEVINSILEEELDVIAEGKRNVVAKRIVEELKLDGMQIVSLDELSKDSCYIKPTIKNSSAKM